MNRLHRFVRTMTVVAGLISAAYVPIAIQLGYVSLPFMDPVGMVRERVAVQRTPKDTAHHGQTAWRYDFSDRADGPLSSKDWNFENGPLTANYNNEAQTYTNRTDNVRIEGGRLIMEAKPEPRDGKNYTSARINTKGKFDFVYGTIEIDAKLPAGRGTWPAAWLLPAQERYSPADYKIDRNDPKAWSLNGEIDFLEAIGAVPGENIPAAHSYNELQRKPTYTPGYVKESATAFHRYGLIKTRDKLAFTIDGVEFASRVRTSDNPREWPFDQPYYLILNLAIGGSWAGYKGIDDASAPWRYEIRSITYTPLPTDAR